MSAHSARSVVQPRHRLRERIADTAGESVAGGNAAAFIEAMNAESSGISIRSSMIRRGVRLVPGRKTSRRSIRR